MSFGGRTDIGRYRAVSATDWTAKKRAEIYIFAVDKLTTKHHTDRSMYTVTDHIGAGQC